MREFLLVCAPYWIGGLLLAVPAIIGTVFNIKWLKETFKW